MVILVLQKIMGLVDRRYGGFFSFIIFVASGKSLDFGVSLYLSA